MTSLHAHAAKVTKRRKQAELAHRAQLAGHRATAATAAELARNAAAAAKMPTTAPRPS